MFSEFIVVNRVLNFVLILNLKRYMEYVRAELSVNKTNTVKPFAQTCLYNTAHCKSEGN